MSKTDKELTVDLVNNYVSAWNSTPNTSPVKAELLLALIPKVYDVISKLEKYPKEEKNSK